MKRREFITLLGGAVEQTRPWAEAWSRWRFPE
jgi:hypothetical protein